MRVKIPKSGAPSVRRSEQWQKWTERWAEVEMWRIQRKPMNTKRLFSAKHISSSS
jgi:hypothetical protein